MERDIDLKEISDGRLYTANDMVKIDCNDCAGCSECCRMVADTIILDPYDIFQLESVLNTDFEALMAERIELSVVDGTILPHLKIRDGGEGCTFLSGDGRCMIHGARPGFCRMFPLGRIYENGDFKYFLQVHECGYPNKTKIKVKKWFGIPELPRYEQFVKDWHFFLKKVQERLAETENDEIVKSINMHLLNQFYVKPYRTSEADVRETDFYEQFYERLSESKKALEG